MMQQTDGIQISCAVRETKKPHAIPNNPIADRLLVYAVTSYRSQRPLIVYALTSNAKTTTTYHRLSIRSKNNSNLEQTNSRTIY